MRETILKGQFRFELVEESRANKTMLMVMYMGGDADTDHPEEEDLSIPFDELGAMVEEANAAIEPYRTLRKILDINSPEYLEDEEEVEEKYGEDMASMFSNVPNDPQTDYSTKCSLDYVELHGYDSSGNKYECRVIL